MRNVLPLASFLVAAMIGAAVILTGPIFQRVFGRASSTLLTVLVIPAIYRVLRT